MNWKKVAVWAVAIIVLVIVGRFLWMKYGQSASTASVTGPKVATG